MQKKMKNSFTLQAKDLHEPLKRVIDLEMGQI